MNKFIAAALIGFFTTITASAGHFGDGSCRTTRTETRTTVIEDSDCRCERETRREVVRDSDTGELRTRRHREIEVETERVWVPGHCDREPIYEYYDVYYCGSWVAQKRIVGYRHVEVPGHWETREVARRRY